MRGCLLRFEHSISIVSSVEIVFRKVTEEINVTATLLALLFCVSDHSEWRLRCTS